MTTRTRVLPWLWKLPICVLALFIGQMLGLALVSALGLEVPSITTASDQGTQTVLFVLAAITITVALATMAAGLAGRWWVRGAILTAFLFGVYGNRFTIHDQRDRHPGRRSGSDRDPSAAVDARRAPRRSSRRRPVG